MMRRTIAGVAGVIVLILLVLGFRGCLDARKERAFKDYARDTSAIVEESNQQSEALFGLLRGDQQGGSNVDIGNNINGYRVDAARLVDRAKRLEPPDQLKTAQVQLVDTLEFRRDGMAAIATQIPTALTGKNRSQSTQKIAAQMQNFLVSDVIYSQKFLPELQDSLKAEDLLGTVQVPKSQFLPDIDWLRPVKVASEIGSLGSGGGGGGDKDKAAAPGLHGTGVTGVTVNPGGTALQAGGANTIAASGNIKFDVQIANQGENEESDVKVKVSLKAEGAKATSVEETLDSIAEGETKTVSVPLAETPPIGKPVEITVETLPVPGEEKVDNNKETYNAVFSRA
ncbi:MAG: hypothetical protein H0V29_13440 [Thermoleophilaceae bacterium]|nr:hypothetical protein [Thermoleophilaceae bacterium]